MSTPTKKKRDKDPMLAALLNLIPLLGLAGCVGATGDRGGGGTLLALLLLLVWGVGYLYLGRILGFIGALLIPWVLIPLAFYIRPWDPEHHQPTMRDITPVLILMGTACVLTAVHARRMAVAHNARLEKPPPGAPEPASKSGSQ